MTQETSPDRTPLIERGNRRALMAQAAIDILGEQGSRGLTHRAIDQRLALPAGTTSAYFRRRQDLVSATIKALFDNDFQRIETLFDTLLDQAPAPGVPAVAAWFTAMMASVRDAQGPTRMLARYECFLLAKRHPDSERLLRESFRLRTVKTALVLARLGARHPDRAAMQFEIVLRGAFFTGAFVPDLLDASGLPDQAYFCREIEAALKA